MKWALLKVAPFCVLSRPQYKCDSKMPGVISDYEVPLKRNVTYKYLALVGTWRSDYLYPYSKSKKEEKPPSKCEASLGDSLYNSRAYISLLFYLRKTVGVCSTQARRSIVERTARPEGRHPAN